MTNNNLMDTINSEVDLIHRSLQDDLEDYVPGNDREVIVGTFRVYGTCWISVMVVFSFIRLRFPRIFDVRSWAPKSQCDLAQDQHGLLSWIWKLPFISDEEILDQCGIDSLCFIRVLWVGFKISCVGIVNSFWLLPIYKYAEEKDDTAHVTDSVEEFSTSHVPNESRRLMATVIGAYILFLYTIFLLLHEFEWYTKMRHTFLQRRTARNYAVYVSGIPADLRSSHALLDYFRSCFSKHGVLEAHVAMDIPSLESKVAHRSAIINKLERAMLEKEKDGESTHISVSLASGEVRRVESIPVYENELDRVNNEIEDSIRKIETLNHKYKSNLERAKSLKAIAGDLALDTGDPDQGEEQGDGAAGGDDNATKTSRSLLSRRPRLISRDVSGGSRRRFMANDSMSVTGRSRADTANVMLFPLDDTQSVNPLGLGRGSSDDTHSVSQNPYGGNIYGANHPYFGRQGTLDLEAYGAGDVSVMQESVADYDVLDEIERIAQEQDDVEEDEDEAVFSSRRSNMKVKVDDDDDDDKYNGGETGGLIAVSKEEDTEEDGQRKFASLLRQTDESVPVTPSEGDDAELEVFEQDNGSDEGSFKEVPVGEMRALPPFKLPQPPHDDGAVSDTRSSNNNDENDGVVVVAENAEEMEVTMNRSKRNRFTGSIVDSTAFVGRVAMDTSRQLTKSVIEAPKHVTKAVIDGSKVVVAPVVKDVDLWKAGQYGVDTVKKASMSGLRQVKKATDIGAKNLQYVAGTVVRPAANLIMRNGDGRARDAGFVAFTKLSTVHAALQMIHHPQPHVLDVEEAPEPDDIYWGNVGMPHQTRQIGFLLSLSLTVLLCFFWTIPIAFISGLTEVESLKETFGFLENMIERWPGLEQGLAQIAPLMLIVLNLILPMVLREISKLEGHISSSALEASVFVKLAAFQIIQTFLVSAITGGILSELNNIIRSPSEIVDLLARTLPTRSTYFVQYVLVSTFLGQAFELMRVYPLSMAFLRTRIGPRKTSRERKTKYFFLRPLNDPEPFLHAEVFAQIILYFMVIFVYATIAPLTCYFLAMCFLILGIGYRHQLVYNYPITDSGGKLWTGFIGIALSCMFLAQLTLMGMLALKRATYATPSLIPLMIGTVLFNFYIRQKHFHVTNHLPTRDCLRLDKYYHRNGMRDFRFLHRQYLQPALQSRRMQAEAPKS